MDIVVPILTLLVGLFAGLCLGGFVVLARSRRESDAPERALIREDLARLGDQLRDMEGQRSSWQGQLRQQVDDVRHTTDTLRRETAGLATALRKPQVRGRWGEMHLRRTVELAGLVDRCDFTEQQTVAGEESALRPDLIVHLPGGRSLAVDAKVPLDAFLDATTTEDPDDYAHHLTRHARQLRQHVDALSTKRYWRALADSPEFVILFLPGNTFLDAALEAEPQLLDYAAGRQVLLATPTSLIGMLRTVAHGWTQQALAEQTREVHELGRTLHGRLSKVGDHLDRLGRSLTGSVEAYNAAIGSLESRVLVTARQFEDLQVTRDELTRPRPVDQTARPLTAPELLDAVAAPRPELDFTLGESAKPGESAGPGAERALP